jgi:hypothetical protein
VSDPHDLHPVRYLTPREFRPQLMQEYIDESGEQAARAARAEAERCALVELITRMTNAGMESPEITRRLADVHTSTIPEITKSTVLYARQLATGSKGQPTPPAQRRSDE